MVNKIYAGRISVESERNDGKGFAPNGTTEMTPVTPFQHLCHIE